MPFSKDTLYLKFQISAVATQRSKVCYFTYLVLTVSTRNQYKSANVTGCAATAQNTQFPSPTHFQELLTSHSACAFPHHDN